MRLLDFVTLVMCAMLLSTVAGMLYVIRVEKKKVDWSKAGPNMWREMRGLFIAPIRRVFIISQMVTWGMYLGLSIVPYITQHPAIMGLYTSEVVPLYEQVTALATLGGLMFFLAYLVYMAFALLRETYVNWLDVMSDVIRLVMMKRVQGEKS